VKVSLFGLFTNLARNMCIGEIFQHQIINHYIEPNMKEYLKVLENKTALLMSASCKCGALLNGGTEQAAELMEQFGLNFGLAYQLVDDFIDHDSPPSVDADLVVKAQQYILEAKKALSSVSSNGSGRYLESLCDFVLERADTKSRIPIKHG
jgi:octaprenyl-diphosphate synthase